MAWKRRSAASPPSRARVSSRSAPAACGRLVVLRREQDLGRFLGDLAPATSTPPSSRAPCRPAGRVAARSAIVAQGPRARRSPAAPGDDAVGIEARAGASMTVGPAGSTPSRSASPSQSSASDRRRSTLPSFRPSATAYRATGSGSARPSREGRASASASIHASIRTRPSRGVLDDRRRPGRRRPTRIGRRRARLTPRPCGTSRTGSPAAAIAAFTVGDRVLRRWKIPAASTASARPREPPRRSRPARRRRPTRRPGTSTRVGDRPEERRCRSRTGCRRGRSRSPAARRRRAPCALRPNRPRRGRSASRPPRTTTSKPAGVGGPATGVDRDDHGIAARTRAAPLDDRARIEHRRAVHCDLVGAGAEDAPSSPPRSGRRRRPSAARTSARPIGGPRPAGSSGPAARR